MTMIFPDFQPTPAVAVPGFDAGQKPGIYRNLFKRLLDVTVIALAAPAVVPVVAVLVAAVMYEGGNPFYSQLRVGRGGRAFRMWKLRSMVANADALLEQHLASDPRVRQEWDETQKLQADPRITRFGKFLRAASLDELPQLWNVLTGDMSLVGPRPMMLNQQVLYSGDAYYALRPGITGYWQTAGRNRTSFAARADIDTAYEAELSFRTDLGILLKTVSVVLRGTGC